MAGTPPQTQVHQGAGGGTGASPGFDWAKGFFASLPGVFSQQYPSAYPGQLDPGLSPTLQQIIRQAQGYASQGPSSNLQGIQGTLGSFMSPNFINPQLRTTQGYPDYYHTDPNAPTFGGGTVGQLPGFNPMQPPSQGGMQSIAQAMQANLAGAPGAGLGGQTMASVFGQPGQNAGSISTPWGGFGQPPTGIFPPQGSPSPTPFPSPPTSAPGMPPGARPGPPQFATRMGPFG